MLMQRTFGMKATHRTIDARLLRLTQAVVAQIDRDPSLRQRMAGNVSRWSDARLRERWHTLLSLPWPDLRMRLLAETDEGAALRQDAPLGGLLAPAERMRIMREFADDSRVA
jgi:hypothetical protein